MTRGFAIVGILLILSLGVAEAGLPKVGDYVQVVTYDRKDCPVNAFCITIFNCTVTGFGEGLFCFRYDDGKEECLGIGEIYSVRILNNTNQDLSTIDLSR